MTSGVLFDIKRFAIHDGPGIRTTLFLKGCPLACPWCHNPESQSPRPELMVQPSLCTGCGTCLQVCPARRISMEASRTTTDRDGCIGCGACAEACPTGARTLAGFTRSMDELMPLIQRDSLFFDESGGGITLSGGEPLHQPEFAKEILRACRTLKIHTAVDTCGFGPWDSLASLVPLTDLFLYDIKLLDPEMHGQLTGVALEPILANLTRLDEAGARLRLRYPVLAGVNDGAQDVDRLQALCASLVGLEALHLLPFHRGGESKWERLERRPPKLAIRGDAKLSAKSIATQLAPRLHVDVLVGG